MTTMPRFLPALLLVAFGVLTAPATFAQAKNYSSGTITVTPANWTRTTDNGVINSISGSAIVTITATNGITVNTLSGGTLTVGATGGAAVATTVGSLAGGRLTVNTSGNLSVSAIASSTSIAALTVRGSISLPGTLRVTGPATVAGGTITGGALNATAYNLSSGTIGANLLGSGGLTKTTAGTVTLTGSANAYTGTTTVTAGTLVIGSGSGLPSGALTVNGGNLDLGGTTATLGTVSVSLGSISNGTISSGSAYNVTGGTIDANLAGTAALTKTGAGKTILTGTNTYSGATTVSAGTLEVSAASLPGDVLNNAVLSFNESSSATYASVVRGRGRLIKAGSGTLTLSGVNTFTGGTTVSAGTLALTATSVTGAIVNNGTVAFSQTDVVNPASFGGVISGTGSLVKDGAGLLVLSGANTYKGGTTINAGTLGGSTRSLQGNIDNNGSLVFDTSAVSGTHSGVISGTGDLTKSGAGTLTLAGRNTYTGGTTVSAGTLAGTATSLQGDISNEGTILFNQAVAGTYAGNISGTTGAVIKAGVGTLTLTGTNTYAGGTTVSAGTLQGNVANLQGNIVNNATLVFDQATDGVYSDIISGAGRVVKTGNGKLTVSGDNIYSGSTTVSGGILSGTVVSLQGAIVNNAHVEFTEATQGTYEGAMSGIGTLTKLGGGTLTLTGANTYRGGTTVSAGTLAGSTRSLQGNITNNATVEFEQVTAGTYAGAISGSGVLVKRGTGVLTLTGTNTYTGGTTVSAGTLSGSGLSLQGDIVNNAAVVFNQAGAGTYAGVMSGTGSLTKSGAGLLTLSGANTYTGGTTVTAGTLQGDTTSLRGQITNNAVLEFNQGTDGEFSDIVSGAGRLVKTGGGKLTLSGDNIYSGGTTVTAGILSGTVTSLQGAIVNNAQVEFSEGSQGTYQGAMSGTGALTKVGAGTLTLTGANTYRGGTTVSAGTLAGSTRGLQGNITNNATVEFEQVTAGTYAGAMSGTGVLLKRGTGVLTLTGANTYTGGTTVSAGTLAGNATSLQGDIANNAAVSFTQAGTGTYAGVMSGTGSLTMAGTGTLILSGANTYTGGTTVSTGTLEGNTVSLQGQIGNNATVAFNESGSGTYAGVMFGSGALRKIGAGTLTLSAGNSYRGVTTVSTGALYVEGNQAGATGNVTVAQGATLGGKGTIGGATTIAGNHRIGQSATGDAAGIQNFSKSLTYQAGAQAFWRLTDNTTDIGTAGNYTYDRAVVGAGLVASNAQAFTFNMSFNAPGSAVDWSDAFWDQQYTGTAGWLVYDAASLSITGTLAPTGSLVDSQGAVLSSVRPDYSFVFYRDNAEGNLYLNYIYSP